MRGLVGRKIGMTRVFYENGMSVPVTVIKIEKNQIVQIKDVERDGYNAIQITTGKKQSKKITKSEYGHFSKANVSVGCGLWEFHIKEDDKKEIKVGQYLTIETLINIDKVDITGTSKGKGFSGVVKRWNFSTQDATHGNSLSYRAPGSIGQNQTPGRVFKGKKMAGHLGNQRITVQNVKIIRIDTIRNLLLVKGSVPGAIGNNLIIKKAIKVY